MDELTTELGDRSVPRYTREVADKRRVVKLARLFSTKQSDSLDWTWMSQNDTDDTLVGEYMRSCIVTIDTGSCTPAILTCNYTYDNPLVRHPEVKWTLRCRIPRSCWDEENRKGSFPKEKGHHHSGRLRGELGGNAGTVP